MDIITADAETYFDDEYSLKKLTTEAYVRDPRFEVHGWAVRWPDGRTRWYTADEFAKLMQGEAFKGCALLAHHAHFDGLILSHRYGVRPHAWLDTLSMAKLVLGNHVRVGLDALAKHFGLAAKSVPYDLFRGRHWSDLVEDVRTQLAAGACHDVELTWQIFNLLAKDFPAEEYPIVDATVRMFTEPKLIGNVEKLGEVWTSEAKRKNGLLERLGVTAKELQSADKFAELLAGEGVEPATKPGKNGPVYAFAKTDEFMKELLEDENDVVSTLAAARLGIKSTIDQTRSERLGFMASRGPLTVYLAYCGAHTTRWSGGDRVNFQNFRRGGGIRHAIEAPAGHKLAIVDLSQIECRILNYLAGQEDVIENFRTGKDPYIGIASQFYGREITAADKPERGTGKQAELSCGFGCGWAKFKATAKLGIYGPPVNLTDVESKGFVDLYRATHPHVVAYWGQAGRIISRLGGGPPLEWGPMIVKDHRIYGPGGTFLIYDTIEFDNETQNWRFKTRNGWQKIYGGKLTENVIQWLARIVLSQACIRIKKRLGLLPVLLAHDEGVWMLTQDDDQSFAIIKEEMARTPEWLTGIPLACEGVVSTRYDKP